MAPNTQVIEQITLLDKHLQNEKRSYFMECKKVCNNYLDIIQKEISEYIPIFEIMIILLLQK